VAKNMDSLNMESLMAGGTAVEPGKERTA
jgi:hypothetical protein